MNRECTCHPDDNPPRPCPQKYAYSECIKAEAPHHPDCPATDGFGCRCNGTELTEPLHIPYEPPIPVEHDREMQELDRMLKA